MVYLYLRIVGYNQMHISPFPSPTCVCKQFNTFITSTIVVQDGITRLQPRGDGLARRLERQRLVGFVWVVGVLAVIGLDGYWGTVVLTTLRLLRRESASRKGLF